MDLIEKIIIGLIVLVAIREVWKILKDLRHGEDEDE